MAAAGLTARPVAGLDPALRMVSVAGTAHRQHHSSGAAPSMVDGTPPSWEPVAEVAEVAAGPEVIKEKKEEGEGAAAPAGAAKAAAPAAKEKEAKK